MFSLKIDIRKNRLYLIFKEALDKEEALKAKASILDEIRNKLKPGFDIINDLSGYVSSSEESRLILKEAMDEIRGLGLNRTIRITSGPVSRVGGLQFQRTSSSVGYKGETAISLEEAEAMLDEKKD